MSVTSNLLQLYRLSTIADLIEFKMGQEIKE